MDNLEALQMIAEQLKIKNIIKAIMLLPKKINGELVEQYMEIMEDIAFDNSPCDNSLSSDPLYQIAIQMKKENTIEAASYLLSVSESLVEKTEYSKPLQNIVDSYCGEKENNKLI
ncbi:MAG: hypothetical protein OSJ70_03390 [Bacilli bacterium]|nr:hypothetical protein [Bacilli bacterium]